MTDLGDENLHDNEAAKRRASNMKARLKELGHDIPLSHVYEVLAAACGHRNWPTMKAALSSSTGMSSAITSTSEEFTPTRPAFVNDNGDPWKIPPQKGWGFELVYAPPGCGKLSFSQALDITRLEHHLVSSTHSLPSMTFIDTDGSSHAFIERAKEMTPKRNRHLVREIHLRTDRSQSINILDTPLGLRRPPKAQRRLIAHFLVSLLERSNDDPMIIKAIEIAENAIDLVYAERAGLTPGTKPNVYKKGLSEELDRDIVNLLPPTANISTWWGIADAFYEAGHKKHAIIAQRFAVPNLEDLCRIGLASDQSDGEIAMELSFRAMRHIQVFPIRSEVTNIPPVQARILAINLRDFLPIGGMAASRYMERAFLIARQAFASESFYPAHEEKNFPRLYASEYFGKWDHGDRGPRGILVYDDVSRLPAEGAAMAQIEADTEQKNNRCVDIRISTQGLLSISDSLAKLAYRTYLLGVSRREVKRLVTSFEMPAEWLNFCIQRLVGPNKSGLSFFVSERYAGAANAEFANLVIGSEGLWAASSNPDDALVRDTVAQEVGLTVARKVLAKRFPSGSAYAEIERRLMTRNIEGLSRDVVAEIRAQIVATLATEIAALSVRR